MKILITGASGFIGMRLADKCQAAGHQVVALGQVNSTLEEFRCRQLSEIGIQLRKVPLGDKSQLANELLGCNVVYHLAAAQHEANVSDQYFWDVNVEGTRNILDASVECGVSHFLHASTIGVYGSALHGEIDENTAPNPDNIYGVTKLEGEKLALQYSDRMPVSVIRVSETYGPGDGRLLKLFKAINKGRFFLIGKSDNVHQLIYVDDLVQAMMKAAATPAFAGQQVVVAGTERLTTADMCNAIAEGLGTTLPRLSAPMWPFLTAAVLMEYTLSPLGIQPPLHRRRLDFFRKSFFFDQARTAEILDFQPETDFRTGVRMTAKWYVANGLM